MFRSVLQALEGIQKGLEMYLDTKRMAFPRFYFLSNQEVLEIISRSRYCIAHFDCYMSAFTTPSPSIISIPRHNPLPLPPFYFSLLSLPHTQLLRDPSAIQPNISKCFHAINTLKFGDGRYTHDIVGFTDHSGEFVPLSEGVKTQVR